MQYNNQPIEIISSKTVFGNSITKIRILSTGQTIDVRTEEITDETHYSTPCTLSGLSIYPNAQYTAFAASGTELYSAYTNDGTSYLQIYIYSIRG